MTTKLTALRLDEHTVIYIEATEDLDVPNVVTSSTSDADGEEEEVASGKGLKEDFKKHVTDLQTTIFAYTNYSLAALKKVAIANVDKVVLEFGIEIVGESGIPYVTKGTAKSNLKIQVHCSFTEDENNQD
jgi:hypothetical protein